jgi:Ca-activated chloride channel family protein
MATTRSDLQHGRYVEQIEISVVDVISPDTDAKIYELEDEEGNHLFAIFEGHHDIGVGDRYCIEAPLGVDRGYDEREEFVTQFEYVSETECPECESPLTFDPGLEDPPASSIANLEAIEATGVHLVVTPESRVTALTDGDDWRPRRSTRRTPPERNGEYRCTSCHFRAPEREFERYLEGDEPIEELLHHTHAVEAAAPAVDAAPAESIGMATGGGKDIENFCDNVTAGYLPDEDALTYEGLFYDYHFETSDDGRGDDGLFYPTYGTAVSTDPLTGDHAF